MPSTVLTASSIGSVICVSISSTAAPGRVVRTRRLRQVDAREAVDAEAEVAGARRRRPATGRSSRRRPAARCRSRRGSSFASSRGRATPSQDRRASRMTTSPRAERPRGPRRARPAAAGADALLVRLAVLHDEHPLHAGEGDDGVAGHDERAIALARRRCRRWRTGPGGSRPRGCGRPLRPGACGWSRRSPRRCARGARRARGRSPSTRTRTGWPARSPAAAARAPTAAAAADRCARSSGPACRPSRYSPTVT